MLFDTGFNRKTLLELAAKVKPRSARDYAAANHWIRQAENYGGLAIFNHKTLSLTQLLIPIESSDCEYPKLMLEVAEKIASLEQRAIIEVINDLLNPDADVVRYRIADPTISSDLSLLRGIEVLEGAKRSLLAAAHSILSPLPYHPRLSRTEAKAFVDQCRLKQTEHGSFVVAIACPLDELNPDQYADADKGHMSGSPVIVKGELHRGRRTHRLSNVTQFKQVTVDNTTASQ